MQQIKPLFWGLFLLDSALNLFAVATQNEALNYATKPLLMPLLAISLWLSAGKLHVKSRNLVLLGLAFSTSGDVLLMFKEQASFFILGLIGFLIAHICYIFAFRAMAQGNSGLIAKNKWLLAPFIVYWLGFNAFLFSSLPTEMKAPVIVYSIVIMTMAIYALNLRGLLSKQAFQLIFLGALLFVMSDSILAAGKFKYAGVSGFNFGIPVMITYILGQFGIAFGTAKATQKG